MGALAKGDVVVFAFPYTDLSRRKLRPCLVLSPEMGKDILLCQITSNAIQKDAYAIGVEPDGENGLGIPSRIRANMLFTAEKEQIQGKIGKMATKTYSKVTEKISQLIETG